MPSLSRGWYIVAIVVPMLAVAIVLKIVFVFTPTPRPDMLLAAEGMVETKTVEDAQAHTSMPIVVPDDLLGGEIYAVGTYTKGAGTLPVGSVAITVVKNGWRHYEIVERPLTTFADTVNDYLAASSQEVALGDATGALLSVSTNNIPCVSRNEKWELPGFCEIGRVLVFEHDGITYSIGADGNHATDGELMMLARSIVGPAKPKPVETEATDDPFARFPDQSDANFENLAYLKSIETRDGKMYVTVDPVAWVNGDIPTAYSIDNADATTQTYELAADAGPYLVSYADGGQTWKTIDIATLAGILDGTIPKENWPSDEEYYDFHPVPSDETDGYATLFHVVVENGVATRIIQKYLP